MTVPFGIISISHKRDKVLELWAASIRRLRQETDYFPVVVCGDIEHKELLWDYDIWHETQENEPVSRKWNTALFTMMSVYDPTYVLVSGSDDVISTELMKSLVSKMEGDFDMIGIKKMWFYCAEGLYQGQTRGIEQTSFMGVCKTLHRRVIEKTGTLWTKDSNWGMDRDLRQNTSPYIKTTAEAKGVVFDIKTNESLNKYTMVQNKANLEQSWPFETEVSVWDIMGEEEKEILKAYESR